MTSRATGHFQPCFPGSMPVSRPVVPSKHCMSHADMCEQKGMQSYMNLCEHTRNEGKSLEQSVFLDSSHDQCGERFTDAEAHSGQHESLCSCLQIDVVTTSICLNSGLFALLYVFFSSFLPTTQNVAVCLRLMSWLDNKHAL